MGGNRHGFTLIELLVVVAIIAILASMLFPVFARARAKARQSACLSNLKQIALAVEMYAQDHNECYNYYQHSLSYPWYEMLSPYMRNRQVIVCPDKREWHPDGSAASKTGYGLNHSVFVTGGGSPGPIAPVSMSQIAFPAETIGGADKNQGNIHCIGISFSGSAAWPYNVDCRHSDGANFFFMDGHAKWMAGSGAWSGSNEMWDSN